LFEARADDGQNQARTMNEEALHTTYLIYGIIPTDGTQRPKGTVGVDGQPVFFIPRNGITAVVSRVNREDAAPTISRLLAYKEVVEAFHQSSTVQGIIPMRYGSMVEDAKQVVRLLDKHRSRYTELLNELTGCVEMGIRVLISECGLRPAGAYAPEGMRSAEWRGSGDAEPSGQEIETRNPQFAIRNSQSQNPGYAYLAARKRHYQQEETVSKQIEHVFERFRSAFRGLFVKWKTDSTSIDSFPSAIGSQQVASIYFLVPRGSLDRFRSVFRQADTSKTAKLLMSGPWPPYNFVEPDRAEREI